jgi:hypothetical protein
MPQLHFYVSEEVAERIKDKAKQEHLSVSRFIAETMTRETHKGWPEGYLESVVGAWVGDFEEPEELPLESRDSAF